jgi:predicted amidohydrolase
LKIVIYQCAAGTFDLSANLQRIRTAAERASDAGASMLICPELMLSGYYTGAENLRANAQDTAGAGLAAVRDIARACALAIVFGYPERAQAKIYNAAALVDRNGELVLNYRKAHLFGDYEKAVFTPGHGEFATVNIEGWLVGVLICYDIEFPEAARLLALQGADLIAVPTALMQPYGAVANVLIPARACENQLYVAYANYCGEEAALHYCGCSTVAAPTGRITMQAMTKETLLFAELDHADLDRSRQLNPYLRDRRASLYGPLCGNPGGGG